MDHNVDVDPEADWIAFKEEHFEVVEQLPLTLFRQYHLIGELDGQVQASQSEFLHILREYHSLRLKLAQQPVEVQDTAPMTPLRRLQEAETPRTPTPTSVAQDKAKRPQTSREMLSHMACRTDERTKASQEKLSIAQSMIESADRHIRFLEQAIKGQQAYIDLGIRSGTQIALPELVVPNNSRPSRTAPISPTDDEQDDYLQDLADAINQSVDNDSKKHKPREKDQVVITFPPVSNEVYCYCKKDSFGEMIACDNKACKIEWFHLPCVGLKAAPEDNKRWYCPDCAQSRQKAGPNTRKKKVI